MSVLSRPDTLLLAIRPPLRYLGAPFVSGTTDRSQHTPTRGCPNVTPCSTQIARSFRLSFQPTMRLVASPPFLHRTVTYLDQRRLSYEIVVVDDGSEDHTAQAVELLVQQSSHVRLIQLTCNMGKGAAVRRGMQAAREEPAIVCGCGWGDADRRTRALGVRTRHRGQISPSDHGRWPRKIHTILSRRGGIEACWEASLTPSFSASAFDTSRTPNAGSSCSAGRSRRICFRSPASTATRSISSYSISLANAAIASLKFPLIGPISQGRKSAPGAMDSSCFAN